MPRYVDSKIFPFSAQQLFDLVSQIEDYPTFLPWCVGARVTEVLEDGCLADLKIGYHWIEETFTSRVTLTPHSSIDVTCIRGPFRHLTNKWQFTPVADGGCELKFEIDFSLESRVLETMLGGLFQKATQKMMQAFQERASALYKK